MNTAKSLHNTPAEAIAAGPTHRPLRIAIVSETYPPEINGVAMTLGRLVTGLLQGGDIVQVIRPRQHRQEQARIEGQYSEYLVTGCPLPGYSDLKFGLASSRSLKELWREAQPDVVHIVTEGPLGIAALKAARAMQLPVTSSFHTNFHRYSRHYGARWLQGLISQHLRTFHNKTRTTLLPTQALAAELGADGYRNLQVMARGVDTQLFNPARRSNELRAQWGAAPDDLVVLYVGRLAAEKNLPLVAQGFAAIHALRPDAKLVVVGSGPYAAKLQQQCPQAVFCGARTGEDLAAHYASGDLFLFPSLTETFGNVVTEALASGVAVLAFAHAAAAELIAPHENGVTVPAGDEVAFLAAATDLANPTYPLAALRVRATASVTHLDWRHIVQRFRNTLALALEPIDKPPLRRKHAPHDIVFAPD